jgi:RNA 2',3'-cyclic 3'-phosphodiesterase
MRLFIAIDLPDEWKRILSQPEESIGWLGRGVKWVEPRGMHLTLKFLGEVDEKLLPGIHGGLTAACEGIGPFAIRLRGTGVFPNARRPRVYWAGIEGPPSLLELQARVDGEMQRLGFPAEEHPFRPHLTLARIKEPIGKQRMTDALLSYSLESEPADVRELLLMRSHLSGESAHYEPVRRCALGGPASSRD